MTKLIVLFLLSTSLSFAQSNYISCNVKGKSGKLKMAVIPVQLNKVIVKRKREQSVPTRIIETDVATYKMKLESIFNSETSLSPKSYWKAVSGGRLELETKIFDPIQYNKLVDFNLHKKAGREGTDSRSVDKVMGPNL